MCSDDPSLRDVILAQKIAGKSDREILRSDLLKDLVDASADLLDDPTLTQEPMAEPMPRAGRAPFGRWFQSEGQMSLEVAVDVESSKQVRCEVSCGFLDVRVRDMPILSGRLAQPVLPEIDWLLDEDASGAKLLCIELTKRERSPVVDSGGGFGSALFESLRVRGADGAARLVEYGQPGLVAGRYLSLEDRRAELAPGVEDSAWVDEEVANRLTAL